VLSTFFALAGFFVLAAVAIAVLWQERRRPEELGILYGVEESIEFVRMNLSERTSQALKASDVRRILEWSVRYLQDPKIRIGRGQPPVAGGIEAAQYVQDQAFSLGYAYDGDLVLEVLNYQREFLVSIGAVGAQVHENDR